jgi:hypothetical protein
VSSTFTTVLYVAGAIGVIAAALKYAASVARWLRAPPPPPFMFTTGSIQGGGGREDLQPIIENQSGERLRVHVTVTAAGETFSDDERIVNPGVTNICVAVPSSVHDALGASAVMQPQSYAYRVVVWRPGSRFRWEHTVPREGEPSTRCLTPWYRVWLDRLRS